MNQDALKQAVAQAALDFIAPKLDSDSIVGVGTGSTANFFIDALAAVNISMPAFYLFAAVVFMLAIGGSVMCGKYIGEKHISAAQGIFSKSLYASMVVSTLMAVLGLVFIDTVIRALGANAELHPLVRDYMTIILAAAPLLIIGFTLDFFVRIDNRPVLAAVAMVAFAVIR